MYYISDGKIYMKEGKGFQEVSIIAKNKVIVTQELESVTVTSSKVKVKTLKNPQSATLEEIIAKFNLSEDNSIMGEEVVV
ncbi:MAG: hypothetical protein FWF85_02480 [Clostridiales bacterium]|nr:hypothetical protein [Clostridiales bacterium]